MIRETSVDAAPLSDDSQSPFDDSMADSDFEDDASDDAADPKIEGTVDAAAVDQALASANPSLSQHPNHAVPEVATPPFNGRVIVVKTKAFQT